MADFKDIQKAIHANNVAKGWHSQDVTLVEKIMLVVTELAEAVECIRNDESHPVWQRGEKIPVAGGDSIIRILPGDAWKETEKPEGVLTELADATIRIMDICEQQGWDLENAIRLKHAYNKTRPYRHGGKVL